MVQNLALSRVPQLCRAALRYYLGRKLGKGNCRRLKCEPEVVGSVFLLLSNSNFEVRDCNNQTNK